MSFAVAVITPSVRRYLGVWMHPWRSLNMSSPVGVLSLDRRRLWQAGLLGISCHMLWKNQYAVSHNAFKYLMYSWRLHSRHRTIIGLPFSKLNVKRVWSVYSHLNGCQKGADSVMLKCLYTCDHSPSQLCYCVCVCPLHVVISPLMSICLTCSSVGQLSHWFSGSRRSVNRDSISAHFKKWISRVQYQCDAVWKKLLSLCSQLPLLWTEWGQMETSSSPRQCEN